VSQEVFVAVLVAIAIVATFVITSRRSPEHRKTLLAGGLGIIGFLVVATVLSG
jgi:CHASE2 domain-containing sensor protein